MIFGWPTTITATAAAATNTIHPRKLFSPVKFSDE